MRQDFLFRLLRRVGAGDVNVGFDHRVLGGTGHLGVFVALGSRAGRSGGDGRGRSVLRCQDLDRIEHDVAAFALVDELRIGGGPPGAVSRASRQPIPIPGPCARAREGRGMRLRPRMQNPPRNSSPVEGTGFGRGRQENEERSGRQSRRHDRRLSHVWIIQNG